MALHFGQCSSSAKEIVWTPPEHPHAPRNVTISKVTNASIQLEWEEPIPSTGPIVGYRVQWKNLSSEDEEDTRSIATFYVVKHLAPYVNYSFRVLALTTAGPGEWSSEVKDRTRIGTPHAPRNVTIPKVTNTSIQLEWEEPIPSTGPIVGYHVQWKNLSSEDEEDTRSMATFHAVKHLAPYVNYSFRVLALTAAGPGDWSSEVEDRTRIGIPSAPKKLQSEQASSTSVFLTWNRPEFPNAPVLDYTLTYRLLLLDDVHSTTIMLTDVSSDRVSIPYVIRNLLPYTYYAFRVSASTGAGQGPASDELILQTDIGVPLPAKILSVKMSRPRTALVLWITEGAYPGPVEYFLEAWITSAPCSLGPERVAKELKGSKRAEEWLLEHRTEVEGLLPFRDYRFEILLKTSVTDGIHSKKSDTLRITPEAPSQPLDVSAECTGNPTELRISWKPPRQPNGRITSYRIHYGLQRFNLSRVLDVQDMCQSQSLVLTQLSPERQYLVSVSAKAEDVREDGATAVPRRVCILPPGIPLLGDTSGLRAGGSGPESLWIEWTRELFSDSMGAIVRYAILVGRPMSLGNATSGRSAGIVPPWFNFSSGMSDLYQATPSDWNPLGDLTAFDPLGCHISKANRTTFLRCTIGFETQCPTNKTYYCNGPLEPDTPYELKIRAFTRGGFTETDLLYACSRPIKKSAVAGKVAAVVGVLFILTSLAAGVYVMKRKGHLDRFICRMQ